MSEIMGGIREVRPELGLTSTQRDALEWLKAKRDAYPDTRWNSGFNPPSGQRALASAMRRALAGRGFVSIQRISERHLRYDITDAGRAALLGTLADANSTTPPTTEGTAA